MLAGYILQLSWTSPAAAVRIPVLANAVQCWRRQTAGTRQFRDILPAGACCHHIIAAIKHSHPVLLIDATLPRHRFFCRLETICSGMLSCYQLSITFCLVDLVTIFLCNLAAR